MGGRFFSHLSLYPSLISHGGFELFSRLIWIRQISQYSLLVRCSHPVNCLLYRERSAQSNGGCLCLMRKAAGRWVVNSQVERRCTGTTAPVGRGCISRLLNKQCSALGYCHQLKKTIKHKPLGAAPGRYEYTLVLFSYFWLGICCWSDTRLDKSLVWAELFLLFYGLVNCHPNSLY